MFRTSRSVSRILSAAALIFLLSVPFASQAAVGTVAATAGSAVASVKTPSVRLGERTGGMNIDISYANLPEDSVLFLFDKKAKKMAGTWSYGVHTGGSGTITVALPSRLARSTFAVRASDVGGTVFAESATFMVTSTGVRTGFWVRQTATAQFSVPGASFSQMADVTRSKAKKECGKIERAHRDAEVSCTWDGEHI